MPKKFGINEKAQAARDREAAAKAAKKADEAKKKEDAKWGAAGAGVGTRRLTCG